MWRRLLNQSIDRKPLAILATPALLRSPELVVSYANTSFATGAACHISAVRSAALSQRCGVNTATAPFVSCIDFSTQHAFRGAGCNRTSWEFLAHRHPKMKPTIAILYRLKRSGAWSVPEDLRLDDSAPCSASAFFSASSRSS
jgi:hypothetical protein